MSLRVVFILVALLSAGPFLASGPASPALAARPYLEYTFDGEPEGYLVYGPVKTHDRYGVPDRAYLFDGVDDFIDLPNGLPGTYTVSVWVLAGEGNIGPERFNIIDAWTRGEVLAISYNQAYDVEADPSEFIGYTGPGDYVIASFHPWQSEWVAWSERHLCFPMTLNDGLWHHLAISFDGIVARLYVDGEEKLSYAFGPQVLSHEKEWTAEDILNYTDLSLGRFGRVGTFFSGALDLVRFYDRALSPRQIAELSTQ